MDSDMTLAALPTPQPERAARRKLALAALVALVLLAGLGFWLTGNEETKQDIATRTEGVLRSAGLDPVLNATRELLAPPPPPAPMHNIGVAAPGVSANGTLIQGTVPTAADISIGTQMQNSAFGTENPEPNTASAPPPGVMPQQREDSVIRPDFVHDLASWLVTRYKPAPQGGKGQINASIQTANMRYGTNMRGMERQGKDSAAARAHILRYAFNPAMLEALYGIYADRLVDDVARTALAPDRGKALSETQLDDLYKNYAAFFMDVAEVTGGIAAMPNLKERIEAIHKANQQTIALHGQITEQVFALDEAREKQEDVGISGLEARIANLNERYRASLQGQSRARASLVSSVRKNSQAQRLDDDSVLFLALWIERRLDNQPDALAAVSKGSALLRDLSRRFENAGNVSQKASETR